MRDPKGHEPGSPILPPELKLQYRKQTEGGCGGLKTVHPYILPGSYNVSDATHLTKPLGPHFRYKTTVQPNQAADLIISR